MRKCYRASLKGVRDELREDDVALALRDCAGLNAELVFLAHPVILLLITSGPCSSRPSPTSYTTASPVKQAATALLSWSFCAWIKAAIAGGSKVDMRTP